MTSIPYFFFAFASALAKFWDGSLGRDMPEIFVG